MTTTATESSSSSSSPPQRSAPSPKYAGQSAASPIRSSILYEGENYDDIAEEHVQRMAAALAPQLDELESLLGDMHELALATNLTGSNTADSLHSHSGSSSNHYSASMLAGANIIDEDDEDDELDDDLDEEMTQLLTSEAILREQMEFADDFSSTLLATLTRSPGLDPDELITPTKRRTMDPEELNFNPMEQRQTLELSQSPNDRSREEPPEMYQQTTSIDDTEEELEEEVPEPPKIPSPAKALPSTPSRRRPPKPKMPLAYTLQDHANHLMLSSENIGGWYYCDLTRFLDVDASTLPPRSDNADSQANHYSSEILKEYCLPVPYRKLKRLYAGLLHHDVNGPLGMAGARVSVPPTPTKAAHTAAMRAAVGSPLPLPPPPPPKNTHQQPPPEPEVQTITAKSGKTSSSTPKNAIPGRPARPPTTPVAATGAAADSSQPQEEPLPVRTMSLRIRPDVLCGAVMEAVHSGFTSHAEDPSVIVSHILKRQGGHLRGALVYPHADAKSSGVAATKSQAQSVVAYVVDVQLCTLKSDELERRLVIRFYHIQDDQEALQEVGNLLIGYRQQQKQQQQAGIAPPTPSSSFGSKRMVANHKMKEACSLIQRLMASANAKASNSKRSTTSSASSSSHGSAGDEPLWLSGIVTNDVQYDRREDLQNAIASHLESNYKQCPSVREENKKATPPAIRRLTLPALSKKDWALFSVSWPLIDTLWEELETRDCTYNTLATLPFGQFPSLPTLDVHYCSQLRRLSREGMISQLLKSAKELEDYAKSAEYSCATLLTLLDPMVSYYGVPPISPPRPKSLEEYPLQYTPPQLSCPPWGAKVVEALNQVQKQTSVLDSMASIQSMVNPGERGTLNLPPESISAFDSVRLVYNAFMKQDDEEQGARLGRKNSQVMDRLSNMQSHQQAVIRSIRDAHIHSKVALRASDDFLIKAQRTSNNGKPGHPRMLLAQVPLLHFRISVGASSSGTCYITPNQILFSTSYIPLVGSMKNMLFDLAMVQFQVVENAASTLLNPFPNTMNVMVNREVAFSFRPSLSPNRLWTFLNVVQTSTGEASLSEFSQPDQAVVEDEDGVLRLANTNSDDQYSI